MELFREVYDALQPDADMPLARRQRTFYLAKDYLGYLLRYNSPDKERIQAIIPNTPINETLTHQIGNLESALQRLDTPQTRCASGFFSTLYREY